MYAIEEGLQKINGEMVETFEREVSCGNTVDIASLGELPENVQVYPYVDQLEVLLANLRKVEGVLSVVRVSH